MTPLVFVLAFALHASGGSPAGAHGRCSGELAPVFNDLDAALRKLERTVADSRGRQRDALRADLDATISAARVARRAACKASAPDTRDPKREPPTVVIIKPPPAASGPTMIDDATHKQLVDAMHAESWDDDKIGIVTLATKEACMTSAQAKAYVAEVSFASSQLELLRAIAPRIADRAKTFTIVDAFTFDSDKKAARAALAEKPAAECAIK